ncbi:uncharacterized protein MEPE_02235 [Melanopsichium pennsylvanicum]|uniref:Meiotically up-regulated gene 152 protein n=2 Tax=Melanopsichium pennsylvanicum TaxID=63383 RepID=A0AAJ4XM01_9BASI|nr:meiotically up-regulated gene 152 protein [Melanopsichium pennsylvanicum 4]SNX83528.1 uncharacterized protein MEPE_02235 [Melanopsichium pennsylvanicum]
MEPQSQQAQTLQQALSLSALSVDRASSSSDIKSEQPQGASHFFPAAQQRFEMGNQSPLSASASADQPGSGYQSSSAQSASGDPDLEGSAPSTSIAGSRRTSSLGRKASEGHRNQKHRWSAEETQALVDGCNKHGVGNWKKILSDPELSGLFSERTAGDLKDRFRTYFPDAYHEMYPNAKTHLSKAVRGRDAQGKSIFEKGKTKERRPFTPEEDAALRAGYQQYGSHWALIAKNPIFDGQRRAIDLRDRFRNAFPEDYERAGFKPRPSKARKDRGPSAAKPGQGHPARTGPLTGTLSDHSTSEGAWRGSEYPLSDATSDGHLTDHGNLTDYSYFTDQGNFTDHGNLTDGGQEHVLSGPSSGASSALGRSNSMGHNLPRQIQSGNRSFGQVFALQQQQQASMQARPPLMSSSTAPLPGAGLPLRASDMVTGHSIHSLFEQLQQASLEGPGTSSETSSIRERATPPSASESDIAQQQQIQQLRQQNLSSHAKNASADDARRQAGKQISHDGVGHKRRSHVTRTGKNSVLERLPSVHGHHVHGRGQGRSHSSNQSNPHSRPQSQSSSQHHSPAGGAQPLQPDPRLSPLVQVEAAQPDVLAWLNPAGQPMMPESAMQLLDQRAPAHGAWSAYSSGASDLSGTSLGASTSGSFPGQPSLFDTGMDNFANQSGFTLPTYPGSAAVMLPGMGRASDSSNSSAAGSRRSSSFLDEFSQQQQQLNVKFLGDQQANMRGDFMVAPMLNLFDPLSANPADPAQWNVGDWDLDSISDSDLQTDDVNELLASLPLSHHPWADDLHHGTTASGNVGPSAESTAFTGSSSQSSGRDQPEAGAGLVGQGQPATDAMLRHMNALNNLSQERQSSIGRSTDSAGGDGAVSFATVTYGDPLVREEREGSPDSLELQREQTFTAKDVGTRFTRDNYDDNKDVEESDDDQRRRSTDTLRRAEGALEAALESVEDTRALAFAQQFQRDVDSDEDSDHEEEADEDGYEEDEEDDNEPDLEPSDYVFQAVLDELQASEAPLANDNAGLSSEFFDGPFGDALRATPSAPDQTGLSGDLSLYPDSVRSQGSGQLQQSPGFSSHSSPIGATPGQAAAAAASMNQMWNSGMPFDHRVQPLYGAGNFKNVGQFAIVQAATTDWTSSPGENNSPGYGLTSGSNRGRAGFNGASGSGGGGSRNASPGQGGNGSYTQE